MIKVDWALFLHHKVILGFHVYREAMPFDDWHEGKIRIIWCWHWQELESIIDVPWHHCYDWRGPWGNNCINAMRWIGSINTDNMVKVW